MANRTMETVTDFIFLGSEITTDGDCSHEIKRRLLLRKKVITTLDSILRSRNIPLPTKVHLVKAMVFPIVMYGCESWIIKNAEHRRIDAFKLWCWRRFFRVSWPARKSNQLTLNIYWKDWCWSWSSNILATWCKELTHWKWVIVGNIEGRKRRGQQKMRWLDGISSIDGTNSIDMSLSKLWERV